MSGKAFDSSDWRGGYCVLCQLLNAINTTELGWKPVYINDLFGESVSIEELIGRNFHHYVDGAIDEPHLKSYTFPDIELDASDDDGEEEVEAEDAEYNDFEGLPDYLPEDCWVKRYTDDSETCYLVYITIVDECIIDKIGCLTESTERMGGGFLMVPGMELPSSKSYDETICLQDKILEDLKMLLSGRAMPLEFSFIGKQLPQAMIDAGGNGGSTTEYTYALQSAYRLAYMHMSVDTDEDGTIEYFTYSSYQSSGSGLGDMFSRPVRYSDRKDEALDMLLHILDKYTVEEFDNIINKQ